ncbi:MAG: PEP-CTERM sorting domain-containing protein [Planctomycetes bacterium]|nr:PEP-CTERM sorting domain-containing protein [Planctomycetota bacterium]
MKAQPFRTVALLAVLAGSAATARAGTFDFKSQLFGSPSSLAVNVQSVDTGTGLVVANGGDSQGPTTPFTWDWGDGSAPVSGWFPAQHVYSDPTKNYIITVTSHYSGGGTDTAQVLGRFVAPAIAPIAIPSDVAVTIPASDVTLASRMPGYVPPATLTHFDDAHFGVVPRSTVEYVLSVGASIQRDLANQNVAPVNGGFQQVVLRDSSLSGGGMYSLWYTNPVSFGAAAAAMQGSIQYSSFMHEMGHNVTLNSPGAYYYGGKIDGNANAIYSESMAQIFQHATAYEMINHADAYGLGEDLVLDLTNSATSSMKVVRGAYNDYVAHGCPFASWNDPTTPQDETFGTFMTTAYKFFEHAENSGQGYRDPLKRTMELLQLFDEDLEGRYDRLHDNVEADSFRATLMVAALSYGFSSDLRGEFEDLNFPIDNEAYGELMAAVPEPATMVLLAAGGIATLLRRRRRTA